MGITMKERKSLFREYASDYKKAKKKEKGKLLHQMQEKTKLNRSYIAWILRNHGKKVRTGIRTYVVGDVSTSPKKRQRPRIYGNECKNALVYFWVCADRINSKRLKSALPYWIEKYKQCIRHKKFSNEVLNKLCEMSHGTIDTLLRVDRTLYKKKPISHTKSDGLLKQQVMVRTHTDWNEQKPGYLEMDLVGHEGGNSSGEFCFTLNTIDIETCWSDFQAIKNKAHVWVLAAVDDISSRVPFPIRGFDTDCGGEFLNHAMVNYCQIHDITFTRGRSYRKNDNCYVEQKNSSIIRKSIFHYRYDTPNSLILLNMLYDHLRLYVNYFLPCSKCIETTHDFERGKTMKKRDTYLTPYHRVIASPHVTQDKKDELTLLYKSLNPFTLKKSITHYQDKLIKEVARQQKAQQYSQSTEI